MAGLQQRLENATRRPDELSPADFDTAPGSQGRESIVAEIKADTALALRDGPIKLAIPAYQSETLAGDGTDQTFTLSAGIAESPDTQDVVVWFNGSYQGTPKSIDYAADQITVAGSGSVDTVHIYHLSPKPATIEIRKSVADGSNYADLWDGNLGLIQQTNQSEQPEVVRYGPGLRRFVASDMNLEIIVNAPYVVRFEDGNGDGTEATNALLELGVLRSDRSIEGLNDAVTDEM